MDIIKAIYNSPGVVVVAFAPVIMIMAILLIGYTPKGIKPDSQGESVYLDGELCTVNMEADDTDIGELYRRFDHCAQQHREFIGK